MKKYYVAQKIGSLLYKILKSLRNFEKKPKPDYIHQLRVNIKKTRAILSFLRKTGSNVHFPKKVCRKLFFKAGEVRQYHLNKELLLAYPELTSLGEHLITLKNIESVFIEKIQKYNQNVIQVMGLLRLGFKLPKEKKIKKYFIKELQKGIISLEQNFNNNVLHQFRMRIKKLMYVYEFLPENIQKDIPINIQYIDELQFKIGLWHDLYSAIQYFEKIDIHPSKFEIIKVKEQNAKNELITELEKVKQKVYKVSELK